MPIWLTYIEERKGEGKELYWFKIWDLKVVEDQGNKALQWAGCNWYVRDGFEIYRKISRDNWAYLLGTARSLRKVLHCND